MTANKKIVLIGATSAMAEQCARLWAAQDPAEMVLVGRDLSKLQRVATDLAVRSPSTQITSIEADFLDATHIQAVVEQICAQGRVDIVLIAHGSLPSQDDCQNDLNTCREALEINALSPVLFAEAFIRSMQQANRGTLAIIGSVAGDRGRKSNYVYGAAKGLVERYVQGLQHRLAATPVKVVLIKPGPTDTPMTAHLKNTGAKLATVEHVARDIVNGIEKGSSVIYTPRIWAVIMLIIANLPRFIFNKMDI